MNYSVLSWRHLSAIVLSMSTYHLSHTRMNRVLTKRPTSLDEIRVAKRKTVNLPRSDPKSDSKTYNRTIIVQGNLGEFLFSPSLTSEWSEWISRPTLR